MKAARLHEYTDDLGDAFTIEDVERPTVEGPDDVIVDVEAAGWCHTDIHIVEGSMQEIQEAELPYTPGHENAGVVAEVGEDVTTVEPGDSVVLHPAMTCGICRGCRLGQDMHCENYSFVGMDVDGGFAEYLRTNERAVVQLDGLDPVEAAPHADAGITAYNAAKAAADDLVPGDVAVLVGMGGLGHIGLQVLHALSPATTVAVDVREEALSLASDVGADHTVNSTEEDIAEVVDSVTDGRGARKIIDFVGSEETLQYSLSLLGVGGDHHVVGYEGNLAIPAQAVIGMEIDFRGTLVGTYPELQELITLAENGDVEVRTETFDLEDINEVARRMHDRELDGRAVFTP